MKKLIVNKLVMEQFMSHKFWLAEILNVIIV